MNQYPGKDFIGRYKPYNFPFFFIIFSLSQPFLREGVLGSKTYFAKILGNAQK